ncbi:TetR family transcriptional regulator [Nostocoides veronense]
MSVAVDTAVEPEEGLRERKKRETRLAIHRAALELAVEFGLDGLTVDAIAERAGVSARTFFNYFPAKDDAILGSYGADPEPLLALIAGRPVGESPREIVRFVAHRRVEALVADPELWAMRREMTLREPSLGLRFLGIYARADRALVEAILNRLRAERPLSVDDELGLAVEAYAALGAFRAAIRLHIDGGYADLPLPEVLDRAFARL